MRFSIPVYFAWANPTFGSHPEEAALPGTHVTQAYRKHTVQQQMIALMPPK